MNLHLKRSLQALAVRIGLICCGGAILHAQSVTLVVSSESAPPGGYAQFKVSLAAPALVSTATISMTFDSTIFGPISNVAAFSATGDQMGYANISGEQVTASVSSASASLGQLPGVPVFIITVPVLATAKAGLSPVTVDPTQGPWVNQLGKTYTVGVNAGIITVGGTLSIQSVTPGGGLLPAGTVVSVVGTGFDAATTVTIDGVSVASTQFVSSTQVNITIGGAVELTGKHLRLLTGGGAKEDFFCALPSAPGNAASTVFLIMPLTTFTNVTWDRPDDSDYQESVGILNQNLTPETITFFSGNPSVITVSPSVTLAPGELYFMNAAVGLGPLYTAASAPMRMLEYRFGLPFDAPAQYSVFSPTVGASLPPTSAYLSLPGGMWTWETGTAAPSPGTISIEGSFPFTAVVSNAPWLTISPTQGTAPAMLTATPDISSLSAGTYTGSITIHTIVPPSLSSLGLADVVLPVSIQVSASPFISVTGSNYFMTTAGSVNLETGTLSVTSNGNPAQYSISVNTSSGGNWLAASPASGVTPGSITMTANPSGLTAGIYLGNVTVQGPANTVTVPIELVIGAVPSMVPAIIPASYTFAVAAGTTYQYQFSGSANFVLSSGSAQTQSGGNWLSVGTVNGLYFDMTAVGLSLGTYQGTITLITTTGASVLVPITMIVVAPSAPLTVTPATVSLTAEAGQTISQVFSVTSNPSTLFRSSGGVASATYTAATVDVGFVTSQPGIQYTSVTFTSAAGSVTVPVVINVTASSTFPPILSSVVNAASGTASAVSPGDIVTLFGTGLGSAPSFLTLNANGKVATTLGGTQVMIGGVAAPLVYSSSGQVNAIVPFEVGSSETTSVQVFAAGLETAAWAISLAPSAPSIFTLSQNGMGQGSIVNADGSVNGALNPASRGSAVQIYAAGGGQTSPESLTGSVAPSAANLALPVTVNIGGLNAQVLYAGSAPGEVEGVVQINAIVPQTVTPGLALPVLVNIGGVTSPTGVTIAIQ